MVHKLPEEEIRRISRNRYEELLKCEKAIADLILPVRKINKRLSHFKRLLNKNNQDKKNGTTN